MKYEPSVSIDRSYRGEKEYMLNMYNHPTWYLLYPNEYEDNRMRVEPGYVELLHNRMVVFL